MKVLYVQYADPALYPPVERGAEIFRAQGCHVSFLGVAAKGQSAGVVPQDHSRPELELLEHRSGGPRAIGSYVRFWLRALSRARREKPDIVYCSDMLAYPAGLLVCLMTNAKTVLHEHDPPAEGASAFTRFLLWARRQFAHRASACIVPQQKRADRFQQETGIAPLLVLNCPLRAEISETLSASRAETGRFTLWHHGSLGPQRLPFTLLDALSLLPETVHLEFAGYETESSRGFVEDYLQYAVALDISDRVHFLGPLSRPQLYERAKQADIGVVMFSPDFAIHMVGASVKPFDYLACGLPLLTNNEADWVSTYQGRGVALACDPGDPCAIAAALQTVLKSPELRLSMAEAGRLLLFSEWNYEEQFQPVLTALHALASTKTSEPKGPT